MRQRMTKSIGISLGCFAALSLGACYNTTNVKNGGLVCGPNDACPDGFKCVKDGQAGQPGHCWRNGIGPDAAGSNPLACTLGDGGTFGPFPSDKCNVVPQDQWPPGTCDPVCQSGCPCERRCVVNPDTYASFLCESAQTPSTFVPVQGTCTDTLSESCAPGSVCIADADGGGCPWLCFRTCRKDIDCPANSRCSVITLDDKTSNPVPNVFLCTPPSDGCNPTGAAPCSTARAEFNCVFMAGLTGVANTDATVCDCRTTHNQALGAACSTLPDDCQPGSVCVNGYCRQVCDRRTTASGCTSGTCTGIYGSTSYGYCK
jgi:hypothetical protein